LEEQYAADVAPLVKQEDSGKLQ